MPLYEFQCKQCGHRFEKLYKHTETGDNLNCTRCGSSELRRLISGFSAPGTGGQNKCASCKGGNCGSC